MKRVVVRNILKVCLLTLINHSYDSKKALEFLYTEHTCVSTVLFLLTRFDLEMQLTLRAIILF